MPETRYTERYEYPKDIPAKDKIPANAKIIQIPYEVSDEQIEAEVEAEARERAIRKLAEKEKAAIRKARKQRG